MVNKKDLVHFLKEDKYRYDRITREEMLKKKHGRYLDLKVREVTDNKAKIELTGEGRPTAASLLIKDWIKSKFEIDVEVIINTDPSYRPGTYNVFP